MKLFFLTLLFITVYDLSAQRTLQGYIILSDTIKGEIISFNLEKHPAKIEFKTEGISKTYTPTDIKGFGIPTEQLHYKTATVTYHLDPIDYRFAKDQYADATEKATVFLKQLVKGQLSLFQFRTAERIYFFVEENNSFTELIYRIKLLNGQVVKDEQYKTQLNAYSVQRDKLNSLAPSIASTSYTETGFAKIFLKLNDQSMDLIPKKKRSSVYLFAGASVCSFKSEGPTYFIPSQGLSHLNKATFNNTISPSLGGEINISNSRLALIGGLGYQYLSYNGRVDNVLEYKSQEYAAKLHLITPSLRLQFVFNPAAPVKFFAGAGGSFPVILNKNGAVTTSTYDPNGPVIEVKGEPSLKSSFFTLGGNAGVIAGKTKFDIMISKSTSVIDEGETKLKFLSIGLRIHYLIIN
jgi:hypothetical protein